MRIQTHHLKGAPVRTVSGFHLGKVLGVEIAIDTASAVALIVRPHGILEPLLGGELTVPWPEIVEFKEGEVIVADGMAKDLHHVLEFHPSSSPSSV